MESTSNPNRPNIVGWMNTLILGDTKTGKSDVAKGPVTIGNAILGAAREVRREAQGIVIANNSSMHHAPPNLFRARPNGIPYVPNHKGYAAQRRNARRSNNIRKRLVH